MLDSPTHLVAMSESSPLPLEDPSLYINRELSWPALQRAGIRRNTVETHKIGSTLLLLIAEKM